jgi:hypothetical protein
MHLFGGRAPTSSGLRPSARIITLGLDGSWAREDFDLVRAVLGAAGGVDGVELDPWRPHVWVFTDLMVDPNRLCDALATWGCAAHVVDSQVPTSM